MEGGVKSECIADKEEERVGGVTTVDRLVLTAELILSFPCFPLEIVVVITGSLITDEHRLSFCVSAVLRQVCQDSRISRVLRVLVRQTIVEALERIAHGWRR